ncbi:MAG: PIN/TRAM domain-containing protein, partial [Terriglobia bacterium]
MSLEMGLVRLVVVAGLIAASYHLHPFGLSSLESALLGAGSGAFFVGAEIRLQKIGLPRLISAAIGLTVGILAALMISHLLSSTAVEIHTLSYVQVALLIFLAYLGAAIGAAKGIGIGSGFLGSVSVGDALASPGRKILDTSAIIDGRISDVCETGFLEGSLTIPQFVLRELQMVADSSDALKRNRGRRGLDMLQKMQKMNSVQVQIVEDEFPKVRGVDMKLIELARMTAGKIITNDLNLNKVAQVQGVTVLN